MSLLKHFKPVSGSLPMAEQTGPANHAVNMLEKEPSSVRTSYAYNLTAEDRATGKYAAKNGVAKALRYLDIHYDNSINSYCNLVACAKSTIFKPQITLKALKLNKTQLFNHVFILPFTVLYTSKYIPRQHCHA